MRHLTFVACTLLITPIISQEIDFGLEICSWLKLKEADVYMDSFKESFFDAIKTIENKLSNKSQTNLTLDSLNIILAPKS